MNRRKMLKNMGGVVALSSVGLPLLGDMDLSISRHTNSFQVNIHQSVAKWCYGDISLKEFAQKCKEIGIEAIDLLDEPDWKLVNSFGLKCSMGNVSDYGIAQGFNKLENHSKLVDDYLSCIPKAALNDVPNLICFSGNAEGLSDKDGLINCAIGLRKIMPTAEQYGVTITMELLNTNDHKDYQCCHTSWGAALCEMVDSENFKLLYDIYHMQIMEGNIIDTIKKYHRYIGHYHTGGVPGRHEIDQTQELNYPAIMKAIVETGYKGYVAHEFIPTNINKFESLQAGFELCNV